MSYSGTDHFIIRYKACNYQYWRGYILFYWHSYHINAGGHKQEDTYEENLLLILISVNFCEHIEQMHSSLKRYSAKLLSSFPTSMSDLKICTCWLSLCGWWRTGTHCPDRLVIAAFTPFSYILQILSVTIISFIRKTYYTDSA